METTIDTLHENYFNAHLAFIISTRRTLLSNFSIDDLIRDHLSEELDHSVKCLMIALNNIRTGEPHPYYCSCTRCQSIIYQSISGTDRSVSLEPPIESKYPSKTLEVSL